MKLRRKADGHPETLSLDDLLAKAVSDEDMKRLPGRGKPVNLRGYASADPTTRVANKILGDNHVLPQPLQDRRDAEKTLAAAEALIADGTRRLEPLRTEIFDLGAALMRALQRCRVVKLTAETPLPSYLSRVPKAVVDETESSDIERCGAELGEKIAGYNRICTTTRSRSLRALAEANEYIIRLNKAAAFTPGVSEHLRLPELDLERLRISEQSYHPFRSKVTTDFGAKLPPVSV